MPLWDSGSSFRVYLLFPERYEDMLHPETKSRTPRDSDHQADGN